MREKAFGEKDDIVVGTDSTRRPEVVSPDNVFPEMSFPTVVLLFDIGGCGWAAHAP